MIEKWTAQGSMAGIDPHTLGPQVPTGGVGVGDQPKNQKTNTGDLARQWARYRYAQRLFRKQILFTNY